MEGVERQVVVEYILGVKAEGHIAVVEPQGYILGVVVQLEYILVVVVELEYILVVEAQVYIVVVEPLLQAL